MRLAGGCTGVGVGEGACTACAGCAVGWAGPVVAATQFPKGLAIGMLHDEKTLVPVVGWESGPNWIRVQLQRCL